MLSLFKNTLYIDQRSCIICNKVLSYFEVDFLNHVFISFLTGRLHIARNLLDFFFQIGFNTCMSCCWTTVLGVSVPIFLVSVTSKTDAVPRIRISGISLTMIMGTKLLCCTTSAGV